MRSNRRQSSRNSRRRAESLVKAISIRQPWAWLIVQGHKAIENRTWHTNYRGPLLIHASVDPAPFFDEVAARVLKQFGITVPERERLELGGIVGQVNLIDCIDASDDPWFVGPFGFVLDAPTPLPFRKYRGRLSLFNVEACP